MTPWRASSTRCPLCTLLPALTLLGFKQATRSNFLIQSATCPLVRSTAPAIVLRQNADGDAPNSNGANQQLQPPLAPILWGCTTTGLSYQAMSLAASTLSIFCCLQTLPLRKRAGHQAQHKLCSSLP